MQASFYEFLKTKEKELLLNKEGFIVLTQDKEQAQSLSDVAKYLGYETFIMPDFRAIFGDDLRSYQEELKELLRELLRFYQSKNLKKILLSPLQTLLHKLPKREKLEGIRLEYGQTIQLEELKNTLLYFGYEFVDLVEVGGEVSFRGDIIDIFLPHCEEPYRISLFGDEIESIREFDRESQLSKKEEIEFLEIAPALFNLDSQEYEEILENIQENQEELEVGNFNLNAYGFWYLKDSCFLPKIYKSFLAPKVSEEIKELLEFKEIDAEILQTCLELEEIKEAKAYEDFEFSFKNILSFLEFHRDKKIILISKSEAQIRQAGINLVEHKEYEVLLDKDYAIFIIGKNELILSLNTKLKQNRKRNTKILLDELQVGDYVVHIDYGVALFSGIIQANIFGAKRDFIELKYLGEDKLLLPVENLDRIDRYIADGGIPLLDRLGKGSFVKLKEKVKEKLFIIASEIVAMAAKRELIEGVKINVEKEEIAIFQAQSGFAYTEDQQRSVEEIFKDISQGRVMDRLLSGDVGFGKTEVAMNALFAIYLSGYQGALIAPTTLLVYQHYNTLKERLEAFGVKTARLDRYISAKEKRAILEGLKSGKIDVVVGTHAIFNVEFQKLALIVVDEEHKFGVKQKEKIKELSENIHLLSMSATPIPRTLNMALSHIKGMSELKTPPKERLAVRTFVKVASEALVKEVILRELRRGGQIFYIHNNISSIERKKEELLEILPALKIAILHSKIQAQMSEDILLEFAKGNFNLLLCTSIVESGIHLPNANTILVDRSDCFGIADLHQLRGRVGRGSKEGFCYFLIEDKEKITQEATKRLLALEKNSYLGSGGALAYHDLEIRGGGNLLGEAQSGHIKNVGYSLYLRMLEEAIYKLSGNLKEEQKNVDVKLSVTAFLSPELISSERLRLELYRRLSRACEINEVYGIEHEIEERFGRLDIYTKQFLELICIKIKAKMAKISSISNYGQNISFVDEEGKRSVINAVSKDEEDILKAVNEELERRK